MTPISTTRLSSKGQVVIPEAIRKRMGLVPGNQFVVLAHGDTLILKSLHAPSESRLDDLLASARRSATRAGLTKADVARAIKRVRSRD